MNDNGRFPPLDFDVTWQPAGGVLSASALELAPLAHLGEALPLPAEFRVAASIAVICAAKKAAFDSSSAR